MSEGRVILVVFGVLALVMIALPVGMLVTARGSVPDDVALKGDVSQFFLAAQHDADPTLKRLVLPGITRVLRPGTKDQAVFDALAASGFTCVPDALSASCFRPYPRDARCGSEWRVSLTFDTGGALTLSEADSRATCL